MKTNSWSGSRVLYAKRELSNEQDFHRLAVQDPNESRPTIPILVSEDTFRPLPEGALVGNEAYYIASIRSERPGCNVYGVEETRPILPCPSQECGYLENPAGEQTCMACDSPLDSVMPVHRRHQLCEYQHFSDIATLAHLTELGLSHPGLLIYPYFVERPYGLDDRYYLVLPDPAPMRASHLSLPQRIARVLDWGDQLASALAHLHMHNISWSQISLDHIALRDRQALWIDFNDAQQLSVDPNVAARQKAQNVVGLAKLMHYLATGKDSYDHHLSLPDAAVRVFDNTLGSDPEIDTAEVLAEAFREAVIAIRRPTTLRLHIGRHTDVGMVRDLNEDSLLVLELDRVNRSMSHPLGLYVVADGMGGHAAGDVASGLAIHTIASEMATHFLVPQLSSETAPDSFDAKLWLADAVQAANQAVYAHRQSAGTNMGTTLVAALVIGNQAYIANVGDSRAYLITDNEEIRQITTDHSLVERLIAMGQIKPDEARAHPQRNVIYRTIGDKEKAQVDSFIQTLNPGDSLLLCSDGLSGKLNDNEIGRIISASRSPQEACELLVQTANDHGGDDNTTVIIIQAGR